MALLALGGCTLPQVAGTAAVVYATKPGALPPANTQDQIPEHETWCYTTMGDPVCYSKAQNVQPNRLVNVEPQNRYPLTADAYRDEIEGKRRMADNNPEKLSDAKDSVEEGQSFWERNFAF